MSVFLITEIKIINDAWVPAFAANVIKFVEKRGGKYLSRSGNITNIEGEKKDSTLVTVMQFNTSSALEALLMTLTINPISRRGKQAVSAIFT